VSTLLFVHGTGVRTKTFEESVDKVRAKVKEFGLACDVEPCPWGDVLGIDFDGLSLPEPPKRNPEEDAQAYRWEYLQIDPAFDLRLWCTPAAEPETFFGGGKGVKAWKAVSVYKPSVELSALLSLNGIQPFFQPAWNKILATGLAETAFQAAGDDAPAVSRVFAEAVVAQMMHDAAAGTPPVAISPRTGGKIVNLLLFEWKQAAKGIKDLFGRFFGSATKTIVRPLRTGASRAIAPAIGDILNYQAVGEKIRDLIRRKVESIHGDVFVFSHSLGGIACFEMIVEARSGAAGLSALGNVKGLITAGSQAPLLYEFGALQKLRKGDPLPAAFPPWLNLYDENDLLSYRSDLLFHRGADRQVDSMLPPLEAHSAYWSLDETWQAIRDLMNDPAHFNKPPAGATNG
jgi:hypothetical protein